jgi:hypothetical protein
VRCCFSRASLPARRTARCSCVALREYGCTASPAFTSRALSFFGIRAGGRVG